MSNKKVTYEDVWKTLRAVDTSKIQYKKQSLDYIGWADAWATLMEYYPQATYIFENPTFYGVEDKQTCDVTCSIFIDDLQRTMSLPVMTSGLPMKSIVNPTSRDINDAQARCLVKAIAMFGLGLHLWEKKDVKKLGSVPSEMPF
ncbi:MAG: hypothetical protein CBC48_12580 [bacterium TMED88]|nr:MAG: hypothetical protein CBC48_12580 [bacterium TMED88]|tara:strand:+ start:3007 stop:3438 length:432 start_codon:yes stop_codon:yes gene_type:complete